MARLTVTVTEAVSQHDVDSLLSEIREHLAADDANRYFRRAEGQLPQFVQILGSYAAWIPLGAAATAFLARLGHRAADSLWDKLASPKPACDEQKILQFAQALRAFAASSNELSVMIGLTVPDEFFGTVIEMDGHSTEQVALKLARFVAAAEEIEKAMHEECSSRGKPIGRVLIRVDPAADAILRWTTEKGETCERRIPARTQIKE